MGGNTGDSTRCNYQETEREGRRREKRMRSRRGGGGWSLPKVGDWVSLRTRAAVAQEVRGL